MKAVKDRINRNIQHIYDEDDSPEAMKKLGIDTIQGTAKFQDDKTLKVVDESSGTTCTVHAKYGVLICTGASPNIPDVSGLESIKYITYENAFDMEEVPEKLSIVGSGPIGSELAQAYSRLGSKVTLIGPGILHKEEPEVGESLKRVFSKEGIDFIQTTVSSIEPQIFDEPSSKHIITCKNGNKVTGDVLLFATGRKPVVKSLGLAHIGVELNVNGGIKVDDNLQSSISGIYAAGDCTGGRQFTHYAGYQGAVGARNILLPFTDPGIMKFVPSTTFTDPQVSSVGLTEEAAKKEFGASKVGVAFKEIKETDRGICDGEEEGFIKIIYRKKGYKVLGATIVSSVAGELISEITMMMKNDISIDNLATVMHTYPSSSFALQAIAAELYYEKLVKLKPILNFLKRLGF